MVAKIESGKSLTGAFQYNEKKVKVGKAKFLASSGYAKSDHLLSSGDKLFRLTDLAAKNIRTKTNTVHLSLNFDINEKLGEEQLVSIADSYMDKIGFGDQPYLVYEHFDTGHPHIHVLTTNIRTDGSRISLNNIGKLRSEPARKEIEVEYGLSKAGDKKKDMEHSIVAGLQAVDYGHAEIKRAVTNVVNNVTRSFKYTSLPELNAILSLYNITAYQGSKGSTMFKHGGLNYWVTNDHGVRVGVPIKASSIYQKPTLKLLQERFKLNNYLRKPFKEPLKIKIDKGLNTATSLAHLKTMLERERVTLVVRQNAEGRVYGLSFIDHASKVIFNGSDLGKSYSAAPVIAALDRKDVAGLSKQKVAAAPQRIGVPAVNQQQVDLSGHCENQLLDDLFAPLEGASSISDQFGPKRRKKKRRKLNL